MESLILPVPKNHYTITQHVANVYQLCFLTLLSYAVGSIVNCYIMSITLGIVGIVISFATIFLITLERNHMMKNYYLLMMGCALGFTSFPLLILANMSNIFIIPIALVYTIGLFGIFTIMSNFVVGENSHMIGIMLSSGLYGLIFWGFLGFHYGFMLEEMISIAFISITLFSLYVAYDTHMMYDRFNRGDYEYTFHVANLSLDIINIFVEFVKLLMLITKKK